MTHKKMIFSEAEAAELLAWLEATGYTTEDFRTSPCPHCGAAGDTVEKTWTIKHATVGTFRISKVVRPYLAYCTWHHEPGAREDRYIAQYPASFYSQGELGAWLDSLRIVRHTIGWRIEQRLEAGMGQSLTYTDVEGNPL